MKDNLSSEKIKAIILGHAVGDALGVPVEFADRKELDESPVTDMQGFGTYPVPAGSWSDDTSMTLCALESLAKGTINIDDIMVNFGKWYYKDEFTPTGEMFDAGNTCSIAIDNYFEKDMDIKDCGLTGEWSNGNIELTPHQLRHAYATILYEAGIKIKDAQCYNSSDEFNGYQYMYYEGKNLVKLEVYDEDENPTDAYEYEYDKHSNKTSEKEYDYDESGEKSLSSQTEYEYSRKSFRQFFKDIKLFF